MAAIVLAVAVATLSVAWHLYDSPTLIACVSLLLVAAALCLARVPKKKGATCGGSNPELPAIVDVIGGPQLHAQGNTRVPSATAGGIHADCANFDESAILYDPFHSITPHASRQVLSTRAAHSTGRHEASYVVAAPCFVGVREAIATALDNVWPQPDMALLAPDGHLVHRHSGNIDTMIPALTRPLAAGDNVTVRLDADVGRVLFVVNGNRAGPSMFVAVGGAYAFIATDTATASTISMIADRL
jgi:hypothetical protein